MQLNRSHLSGFLSNKIKAHGIQVTLLNSNKNHSFLNSSPNTESYSFFLGKNNHASNVKSFPVITYRNVYEGIDMIFLQKGEKLKYEFIVDSKASPYDIILEYQGADKLYIENRKLYIKTQLGFVIENAPVSYQIIDNDQIIVPTEFRLRNKRLSFRFPKGYDPNYVLYIDPELIFFYLFRIFCR